MLCSCSFDLLVVGGIPDANSRPPFVLSAVSMYGGYLLIDFPGLSSILLLISSKRILRSVSHDRLHGSSSEMRRER